MKVLIAVDMEGITGLVNFDQVTPTHPEYQRFRRLMTADVNAAIRGASQAGADDFLVTDGHWNGDNILIEELDPRARLNSGSPAPFSMVQGIDSGVQAALFVGYHARAGTLNAILDHTYSSARVANLWINDRLAGETALNGLLCGHFGVPVVLVTGDQSVCAEAREWIPGVETAAVKQACGRQAAEVLPPAVSHPMIETAAYNALVALRAGKAPAPLKVEQPVRVRVEFFWSDMADRAIKLPGAVRIDGRTVEISAPDMPAAHAAFRALVTLAQRV